MQILLVDDSALLLATLRAQLERGGHDVLTAESGESAVQLFQKNPNFDLIITDLMMGEMNGIRLTALLRKINPSARIWLNTSGNVEGINLVRELGLEAGAEKVLLKNDTLDELRRVGILS